ncbi:MAG: alanine--glyoxylate aminotransferase family protein [Deltaproteobacteria bacterium]
MEKTRLFTPGPTPVLPEALKAMSEPIIHHRSRDFMKVLEEVRGGLKYLLETEQEVLILAASGTGGMEGVVTNLFSREEKVLVVRAGKFGQRWGEIAQAFGLQVVALDIPWGEAPTAEQIRERLLSDTAIRGVFLQACETSTGVDFPIEEIANVTRERDTLLVVDAISYLGISELPMDRWGVDVVVSGSQKGLMLPPGLAFVCLSRSAWEKQKKSLFPKYYFDFSKELKSIQKNQTAYTPAVSLMIGLREVLRFFQKKTKEKIFSHYEKMSNAMRSAVQALELELFSKRPSHGLVSICVPENVDGKRIVSQLKEKHRIYIAGGQDQLTGKIVRISCMGHLDAFDIISAFSGLEEVLRSEGANIPFGKGVQALERLLLL